MIRHSILIATLIATSLSAQRVLHQGTGVPGYDLGTKAREAGDFDGDGVGDLLVPREADSGPSAVEVVSGRTGSLIRLLGGIAQGSRASVLDAVGVGDVNGDGRDDVAVVVTADLTVFSGMTGSILYRRGNSGGTYSGVCPVEDWNLDGRPDIAVSVYASGTSLVQILSGADGTLLRSVSAIPNNSSDGVIRSLGDLGTDGREELALMTERSVFVVSMMPGAILRTIDIRAHAMEAVDVDGDGRKEIALAHSNMGELIDPLSGNTVLVLRTEITDREQVGRSICGIGDLDADGFTDLAVGATVDGNSYGGVLAFSGRSGSVLWRFAGWQLFAGCGAAVCDLGDVNADGYHDLGVGCPRAVADGGWLILSGRVLANVEDLGGSCGASLNVPRLNVSRPVLGHRMGVHLSRSSAATNHLVALSVAPVRPTYLGASTCTAWFDLGSWALISAPTTSPADVLYEFDVPDLAELAGLEVSLQGLWWPTLGPLGFDLSNGVRARFGY